MGECPRSQGDDGAGWHDVVNEIAVCARRVLPSHLAARICLQLAFYRPGSRSDAVKIGKAGRVVSCRVPKASRADRVRESGKL